MSDTLLAALITAGATLAAAVVGLLRYGPLSTRWTLSGAPKRIEKLRLTWRDVRLGIQSLSASVRQNYAPDLVVGISRGGAVIAGAVAKRLDCDLVVHRLRHEQTERDGIRWINLGSLERLDLHGKKVLLVNDAMRTGQLVATAVALLKRENASELRTAILIWTTKQGSTLQEQGTVFRPDYCAYVTSRIDYEFPWIHG